MRKLLFGAAAALSLVASTALADTANTDNSATGGSTFTGTVKGIDTSKNLVTIQLPLAPGAAVMRSGHSVALDAVKKGDDVRADFDPSTNTITRINIEPKGTMKTMNPGMTQ